MVSNWECFFVHRLKRVLLISEYGWHKIGWKETKHWSDLQTTQQRRRFGRTNIFPWSCIPGVHSKTMPNKQRYCGQLQNHVWIANFRGGNTKASILWESLYFFMAVWYGGSCKELCGATLWVSKQDDSTTLQSIYSPCIDDHHFKEGMKCIGELSQVCSQIVLKMFKIDTNWKTRYSMVSEQTCTIKHKMDQSLWQTLESIYFIHSSHMWIQTVLQCG